MSISVSELKARLAQHLRRVEQGETVAVTRRGRVIARFVPPESAVERLRRQPWIVAATGSGPLGLNPPVVLDHGLPPMSDTVSRDRDRD
ncbi:type II toxin-antitoxin system Phd/YefM family antitoxin [Panacagrimonas sp.]|uniref:type II toxin-antitoxin system Phd/YefM family antitoxin n=1 Tax=Panacagrimonas sp. TaxID=2480088 RepID=UPI003B518670